MSKQKLSNIEPEIVFKSTFWVVGLLYSGPQKLQVDLWEKFIKRVDEIEHRVDDEASYGVCYVTPEMISKGELNYMACVAVDSTENIPEGMVTKEIRGGDFIVATHKGSVDSIMTTLDHIFQSWLPNSEYEHDDREDFEYYDDRFDMDSPDSEFDIFIPVKKK